MRGGELFFHLRKAYKFKPDRTRFYIAELVLAIEFLHKKGIIYRYILKNGVVYYIF